MSTPDAQDKKFHNSRLSPCGQQPPRRRAAVQITPAPQSPPAAEALSDARYSWQVDGMDCAACARKVETAVRQVPGVSQVGAVRHRKAAG